MRSSPVVTRFHLISPDLIWFHLISSHTTPAAGHFLCLISHVLARSPDFIFWWHLISSLLTWCHLLWCHHNYLQQLVTCLHNVQLRSIIFTFCNYSLFCQMKFCLLTPDWPCWGYFRLCLCHLVCSTLFKLQHCLQFRLCTPAGQWTIQNWFRRKLSTFNYFHFFSGMLPMDLEYTYLVLPTWLFV